MSTENDVSAESFHGPRVWRIGDTEWRLGDFPLIMGIVNVTPDSFSDGSLWFEPEAAVDHALALVADGAELIDIGGESTRPGADRVSLEEELRRVVPVVQLLARQTPTPISIDTTKSEVARQALDAGAVIVNDVSGLLHDPQMLEVCARMEASVICMHIRGTPQTMQDDPRYDDVVCEIGDYFEERLRSLEKNGLARDRVVLDPGIGFGKTAEHNLDILASIRQFHRLGRPVMIGHSRKRFLQKVLGRSVDERLHGTLGVAVAIAEQKVDIIRVHDVRATRDTLLAWRAVMDRVVEL